MPHPSVSVALCTFNGERFLDQQLHSILRQSRQPDELLAFDDGSTDSTLEILQTFAGKSPFPVQVHQNDVRRGVAQNFAAAIAACNGEIISFCDQDDIWEADKVDKTLGVFSLEPKAAFVFSDALMCDDKNAPLDYRLWNSVNFTHRSRRLFTLGEQFEVLLRYNIVTGATLSFSARFKSLVLPIPTGWMHDGWIALLLSAVGGGVAIDDPLVRYRQHATQSIGAQRRSIYQQYLNAKAMDRAVFSTQADAFESALTRLQEQTDFEIAANVIRSLQQKIEHCRLRAAIREHEIGRIAPCLTELLSGRYQRYSLGWKSFAQDLFL